MRNTRIGAKEIIRGGTTSCKLLNVTKNKKQKNIYLNSKRNKCMKNKTSLTSLYSVITKYK